MNQKKLMNQYVTDTQIIEIMHAYVKGTKVSPWAYFLSKSPEETMGGMQIDANLKKFKCVCYGTDGIDV